MSLLTSYEGLRHQIERLVRENEELKKLARLIRENHELKSAIKTQAGGLGLGLLHDALGEAATGPSQCHSVFLPPSPAAAANESVLEEVAIVTLAPLTDMLKSPQPGPTAGSIVSPLAGPPNTLLPSPGPMSQNSQLASLLTGPMAVPVGGALTSTSGLPSTGPLTPSSHLSGPMAVPVGGALTSTSGLPSTGPLTPSNPLTGPTAVSPAGTLASSLGLPSTGPLTGSMAMPQSSPLMAPMTGTMAVSLSSPLLTSTAGPPGVSQNPLANPMNNLVPSEAPRVQLAELPRRRPSGPHPSAGTGPAAVSEVPLSTEYPRPTQDPEALGVTFVGAPIQTSTPAATADTPGAMTAFSYGTPDAGAQPGAAQAQGVLASVSASALPSAPTPAPQAASHTPTRPSPTSRSPPRNPCSPPRASSSPASVHDTRGPRAVTEPARSSLPEAERKLARRKGSKLTDCPREPKQLAWERLVGEIAFQLDRRILSSIFPERVRLYGFTVANIPEKIIQASLNPSTHKLDEALCQTLTRRYVSTMNRLQGLGYNGRLHPALTEQLVNAYGILRERPELAASEGGSYTLEFLQHVLVETVHPNVLTDALLLLSCLSQLSHDDGKPMFIW